MQDHRRAPALQTTRLPRPSQEVLTYFAKDGLGFKVRSHWLLKVPKDARDHLRIGWGSPGTPGTVVRPPAGCQLTSTTGWVWYPGGYWTDRPGCYPLVVEVGHRHQRVEIGVGAPCRGQKPPAAPSDK